MSVAISITTSGLNLSAKVNASHKINLPSASVFNTSIVWPDILVKISPGFKAKPSGKFSHVGIIPITFMGRFNKPIVLKVPRTLAAPHISYFISSISPAGLIDIPPASKVIPLPTKTIGFCVFLPLLC